MKFTTLTLLTAAIANLSSSSAVFAADDNLRPSFGEQEASLSVGANDEKHFSWMFSAELRDASGDISSSECVSTFDDAFIEAWNEAHAGEDVQAEECSVTSVTSTFLQNDTPSLTTTGGKYYYGTSGYCKRCNNALTASVTGKDFEGALTDKCAASSSCPAFATISKIKIKFLPYDAIRAFPKVSSDVITTLGQDKKYFRKPFKTMLKYQGGSGVPTDESCFGVFDETFVKVYSDVHAGEDTQIEMCLVESVTPGFMKSSVRGVSVEGGKYYYNSEGNWVCRRCNGYLAASGGVGKDLDAPLSDALVAASPACFDGLSSVKVILNGEDASKE